jgi:hypothetical protein
MTNAYGGYRETGVSHIVSGKLPPQGMPRGIQPRVTLTRKFFSDDPSSCVVYKKYEILPPPTVLDGQEKGWKLPRANFKTKRNRLWMS